MRSKGQEGLLWPILAGTSLAARIRRVTFAVFGLAAACGLALVSFVAQTGYPVLSVAPLPLTGPAQPATGSGVALGGTDGGSSGLGFGLPGLPGQNGGPGTLTATPTAAAAGGEGVLTSIGSGGSTQSGLDAPSGKSGLDGEQHADVTAVTPAQHPTTPPPESAVASIPVEGSNTSSALFVRTSVAPGLGEEGDVADSAPLPPDESEIPYEPEPTAEPEPPAEPPVEPEPEPQPPAEEPPLETEPPAEAPPVAEPAPEVPAGQ